ncbi:MAG: leucine-rich repeat domain-containing protein [Eubacteriaceae bacterium]|nr:leucine-rich repeat domain-containing protein [Eubacteriaceae bacterium]
MGQTTFEVIDGTLVSIDGGDGKVILPDGIAAIGERALSWQSDITSVIIPEGVKTIGKQAFAGCGYLRHITLPESLEAIGEAAFWYCRSLETVTIPGKVEAIADGAFTGCKSLQAVTVPDSVAHFGQRVFCYCDELAEVSFGKSVPSVDVDAFNGCEALVDLFVSPDNPCLASADGVLFNRDMTTLVKCPVKKEGEYKVPSGVINIGERAFEGAARLTEIILPKGLVAIGRRAFESCLRLKEIKLPGSVRTIGAAAFMNCGNLTDIEVPEGVELIDFSTFENCRDIVYISLPDSVRTIEDRTFRYCDKLTTLRIPNGLERARAIFSEDGYGGVCKLLPSLTYGHIPHQSLASYGKEDQVTLARIYLEEPEKYDDEDKAEYMRYAVMYTKEVLESIIDRKDAPAMFGAISMGLVSSRRVTRLINKAIEAGLTEITAMLLEHKNRMKAERGKR